VPDGVDLDRQFRHTGFDFVGAQSLLDAAVETLDDVGGRLGRKEKAGTM